MPELFVRDAASALKPKTAPKITSRQAVLPLKVKDRISILISPLQAERESP
jgi:hypothetical protein